MPESATSDLPANTRVRRRACMTIGKWSVSLLLLLGCSDAAQPPGPAALGVDVRATEDGLGVIVQNLEEEGPAARANLQPGDVIHAIDGTPVDAPCELDLALRDRFA